MLESEDSAMHACTFAAGVAFDLATNSLKGSSTPGHQRGRLKKWQRLDGIISNQGIGQTSVAWLDLGVGSMP